jgi:hypothetical protein
MRASRACAPAKAIGDRGRSRAVDQNGSDRDDGLSMLGRDLQSRRVGAFACRGALSSAGGLEM